LADRLEAEGELLLDLSRDLARDANPAGFCQLLQPRRDIDSIAIAVLALDDDLAEVDPDAHMDAPFFGHRGVALRHVPLEHDSTFNGVDYAAELGEQPVAHELEDAPVMLLDLGLEEVLAMRAHPLEGVRLVLLHEAAIADHVGREDRRKLAFHGPSFPGAD